MIKCFPNILTVFRLLLIPLFVYLLTIPSAENSHWAMYIFMLAAFTDFVDGKLARHYGAVTDFGKLLDPVADKILVMSALVMLVAQTPENSGDVLLPGWVVVLILARETWVTGLRSLAASRGMVIAAGQSGKIKSAMQMLAITLMLARDFPMLSIAGRNFPLPILGVYILLLSITVSYWGAVEYSILVLGKKSGER